MKIIDTFKLLCTHRKEFEYCRRTWKVPLCWCDEFLKTDNCKHVENLMKKLRKHFKSKK